MANWGHAISQGLAAGAKSASGLLAAGIQEDAEMRAADRKLADAERLAAIQEAAQARAEERREQLRQSGRAADFTFDTNPENVKAKAGATADATRITEGAKNDIEREEAIRRGTDQKYLSARRNVAAADQAPERAGVAEGRMLENQLRRAEVENLQRVQSLKKEFATAPPERQKQIRDELQLLSGKDNDSFLPIAEKDEFGNVTGYKIFDKKQGEFVGPKGGGGGGQGAPYPDGTRLKGRDGKTYIVKGGQPVLDAETKRTSGGLIKQ